MKAVILEQAQKELQDAIEYYEGGQDGLGLRFLADFEEHVGWVKETTSFRGFGKGATDESI